MLAQTTNRIETEKTKIKTEKRTSTVGSEFEFELSDDDDDDSFKFLFVTPHPFHVQKKKPSFTLFFANTALLLWGQMYKTTTTTTTGTKTRMLAKSDFALLINFNMCLVLMKEKLLVYRAFKIHVRIRRAPKLFCIACFV